MPQQVTQYPALLASIDVVIANGESLSAAANIQGTTLVGIQMPAAWTAASLTVQGSVDGTNYFDLFNSSGSETEISAAASRMIWLNPADFALLQYIKIRSGTSGSPQNQGAERTITLITRSV